MTNHRMKPLQQLSEHKKEVIQNVKQQIQQPSPKKRVTAYPFIAAAFMILASLFLLLYMQPAEPAPYTKVTTAVKSASAPFYFYTDIKNEIMKMLDGDDLAAYGFLQENDNQQFSLYLTETHPFSVANFEELSKLHVNIYTGLTVTPNDLKILVQTIMEEVHIMAGPDRLVRYTQDVYHQQVIVSNELGTPHLSEQLIEHLQQKFGERITFAEEDEVIVEPDKKQYFRMSFNVSITILIISLIVLTIWMYTAIKQQRLRGYIPVMLTSYALIYCWLQIYYLAEGFAGIPYVLISWLFIGLFVIALIRVVVLEWRRKNGHAN